MNYSQPNTFLEQQKAVIYINGYSTYLPKNYFTHSLERAMGLRILRENPKSLPKLIWYFLSENLLKMNRYQEFSEAIERLGSQSASRGKNGERGFIVINPKKIISAASVVALAAVFYLLLGAYPYFLGI